MTDKEAPPDERAKLLPCPFCGEAPTMIAETERDGFVREFVAHCDTCAIGMSAEYESDAISAWNRRAGQQEEAVLSDLDRGLLEQISDVLEWYGLEADALARNLEAKNVGAVTASAQVLGLDAGKRAARAIASIRSRLPSIPG